MNSWTDIPDAEPNSLAYRECLSVVSGSEFGKGQSGQAATLSDLCTDSRDLSFNVISVVDDVDDDGVGEFRLRTGDELDAAWNLGSCLLASMRLPLGGAAGPEVLGPCFTGDATQPADGPWVVDTDADGAPELVFREGTDAVSP